MNVQWSNGFDGERDDFAARGVSLRCLDEKREELYWESEENE